VPGEERGVGRRRGAERQLAENVPQEKALYARFALAGTGQSRLARSRLRVHGVGGGGDIGSLEGTLRRVRLAVARASQGHGQEFSKGSVGGGQPLGFCRQPIRSKFGNADGMTRWPVREPSISRQSVELFHSVSVMASSPFPLSHEA
jgi:hypothetical protein